MTILTAYTEALGNAIEVNQRLWVMARIDFLMWCRVKRWTYCDKLVVFHAYDVAHDHFMPPLLHQFAIAEHQGAPVVYLVIAAMSLLQCGENNKW